ncbi:hypothetical protein HPB47_009921, partial [Ixodes persulcatus]
AMTMVHRGYVQVLPSGTSANKHKRDRLADAVALGHVSKGCALVTTPRANAGVAGVRRLEMIGARGDKCIRIKTHPSHSIIDSVHEWERDGLFPVLRKDRRAQDDVPVSPSRSSGGGGGAGDGTKTSPCAQGSNRSRHQPVLPPLPIMAPRRSK